jgi:hypothetical protein
VDVGGGEADAVRQSGAGQPAVDQIAANFGISWEMFDQLTEKRFIVLVWTAARSSDLGERF